MKTKNLYTNLFRRKISNGKNTATDQYFCGKKKEDYHYEWQVLFLCCFDILGLD